MASFVFSPRFDLKKEDLIRWVHNSLVFLAPVAIVAITALMQQIPQDWAYGAFVLYVLNIVADIVRKWVGQNTYRK